MKGFLLRLPPGVSCANSFPNIIVSGPEGKVPIYLPAKFIQRGQTICFSRSLKNDELIMFKQSIFGVSLLYKVSLTLQGIGYKAEKKNRILFLKLGYSHDVQIFVPENIQVRLSKTNIIFYSVQLIVLNNLVSTIRKLRLPDPYKGSGILYEGEMILKKEGKKT